MEPKEYIDKLWGKQRIRDGDIYRMMRYVFRVDHDGKVLLHNVVTGQLVVLDQGEADAVEKLPQKYGPVMEKLVAEHFLVPERSDEHQQVINLRKILRDLADARRSEVITHFTILPTTACNARCYYCFEQGIKPLSMSEATVNELIAFISRHCGKSRKISITWFGGEPTLATKQIDQICIGLRRLGIEYSSQMISNGYLFDEEMASKAKSLWNLQSIQISVDGTEERYNKIKSYVYVTDNPYQRVMRNVGLLLDKEIHVNLRMNFDLGNHYDFKDLVDEVSQRYGKNRFINVRAHPINGEYADTEGTILHGTDEWFSPKIVELYDYASAAGLFQKKGELPSLRHFTCMASNDTSVTITPDGHLVNCPEHTDEEYYIGSIQDGITNLDIANSWKEIADYPKCSKCFLYPYCIRVLRCSAKDSCSYLLLYIQQLNKAITECLVSNNQ